MLRGISPLISPELLALLARMGHGDEIVLADAHFPGESFNARVLRADGIRIPDLLGAILPLMYLDQYDDAHLVMMAAVEGDELDPQVERDYLAAITPNAPDHKPITRVDRFDFLRPHPQGLRRRHDRRNREIRQCLLKKGVPFLRVRPSAPPGVVVGSPFAAAPLRVHGCAIIPPTPLVPVAQARCFSAAAPLELQIRGCNRPRCAPLKRLSARRLRTAPRC